MAQSVSQLICYEFIKTITEGPTFADDTFQILKRYTTQNIYSPDAYEMNIYAIKRYEFLS